MESEASKNDYFIWGIDDSPYGPVQLPVLIDWINDERVLPDTWIFTRSSGVWKKAEEISEVKDYFGLKTSMAAETSLHAGLKPGALRRIKILANLNDAQLAHLAEFMEPQEVPQWTVVIRQGEPGDAMYLIMSGELRARTIIGEQEAILMTFGAGDFFGEMALFDQGPRSADVVANVDCSLLRLSAGAFERLTLHAPNLAAPFLQATAQTLSARIRADNKRLVRVTQQFAASQM